MSTNAHDLLRAWDRQQTALVEHRDDRTACLVLLLRRLRDELGRPLRVLDLGCGPGSVTNAVLAALGDSRVTAVDRDPVLLRLFAESTPHPDRVTILDRDLRCERWADGLPDQGFDAAVSATALHWLSPEQLTVVYRCLGRLVAPGGLVLDADHLDFDPMAQPWLRQVAAAHRDEGERRLQEQGAQTWDQWWADALAQPGWEAEARQHHERWADDRPSVRVDVEFHRAALRAAGFTETAQVWQWLDDRIVLARRPTA